MTRTSVIVLVVALALVYIYRKLTFRVYSDFDLINQVGKLPRDYSLASLVEKPKSGEQKAVRVKVILS